MNFATSALNAMLMEAIQREANLRVENLALKAQIEALQAPKLPEPEPEKGPQE